MRAIFTERGSEGITLGLSSALYAWGVNYDDPKKPYQLDGFTNSPAAVEALEFYKKLFKECTPPGYTDATCKRAWTRSSRARWR